MLKYVGRRLGLLVPTLLGVCTVSFVLINLAPGGPIEQKLQALRLGRSAGPSGGMSITGTQQLVSPETLAALNKQYGFDQPLSIRYGRWLKNALLLNFGKSSLFERPALEVIGERAPVSLAFGGVAFFFTYSISVGLGLFMARRAGRSFDSAASLLLVAMAAVPAFILGVLLLVFFAGDTYLNWFPIGYLHSDDYSTLSPLARGWDLAHHAALPLTCYVFGALTALTLLERNTVLSESQKDYVRTARAKGVGESRIYSRHILRNALLPLVTGLGGSLALFLSGSVLVESVFQIDGLGLLSFQAVMSRDYNLLMAILIVTSLILLLGNLLGDLVYMWLDPTVRLESGSDA